MEANRRWALVTAVAPVAWGATYYVTRHFLPADAPFWGAALRALPAGLLLMFIVRRLPHGSWWWRSCVLGALNFGGFFVLVYVSAQLLATSIAASVMAFAPIVLAGLGWLLLDCRPTARTLLGAVVGIVGVLLVVGPGVGADLRGLVASVAALLLSALGSILTTRWRGSIPLLRMTAWQLTAGGLMLTLAAVVVEGAPPAVPPSGVLAFGYVSVIATALAFVCWFTGLSRIDPTTVGVIGLLNPVTGVALGATLAAEPVSMRQAAGIVLVIGGILAAQSWPRSRARHRLRRSSAAYDVTRRSRFAQ